MEFKHTSVLLNETTDGLNVKSGGIYIDATLGGGGHSERVFAAAETLPPASFIPPKSGSDDRRRYVAGSMFTPVRDGTL